MNDVLQHLIQSAAIGLFGTIVVAGLLTAFGSRPRPPALAAVNAAFESTDWAAAGPMPPLQTLTAADGAPIAWRSYPAATPQRTAILVHGSSADSRSLHLLAQQLARHGTTCHAIDIRGHGGSGTVRGDIGHIGQLEEDLAALVAHLRAQGAVAGPLLLLGHSSGGGFTLRVAGGALGTLFAGHVLAAPFLHHGPPVARPQLGDWAVPFVPRIIGLTILHHLGLRFWEHLPVIAFATPLGDDTRTTTYSFRLQRNFRPGPDWRADVRALQRPTTVLIGADDELFDGSAYPAAMDGLSTQLKVEVLPRMPHVQWYLAPAAIDALDQALRQPGPSP